MTLEDDMATDKQAILWAIIAIIVAISIPIIGFIMRLITSPRLRIGTPYRDHRSWAPILIGTQTQYTNTAGTVTDDYLKYVLEQKIIRKSATEVRYYIHIPIINETGWRFESTTAKDIHVKLLFYNLEKNKIGEFDARWEHSDQPIASTNKSNLKHFNIRAGETENIDFA